MIDSLQLISGPQVCDCGNSTYGIRVATFHDAGAVVIASCADCGRITGTVGEHQYRAENINDLLNEEEDANA